MSATEAEELLTVGQTAELVGVSVRTLHHWDQIRLVCPVRRPWSDYRLYDADDIARLHRVLVYRELGFELAQIGALLDDPDLDPLTHLREQHELLLQRISRLQEMVSAVDQMMEAEQMNARLTPQQQATIFGADWNPEYAREAEERWGDTDAWAQSQQRTAQLTAQDWAAMKAEGDALNADLAQALRDGVGAGSAEANAMVERHRAMVGQIYDCSHAMQVCLGEMYVADPRFAAFYDDLEPGLATWLRESIRANAAANGVDPDTATWQ